MHDMDSKDEVGLIGGYAHGNEPGHHVPYLYNFIGKPWKTQRIVHRILTEVNCLPRPVCLLCFYSVAVLFNGRSAHLLSR